MYFVNVKKILILSLLLQHNGSLNILNIKMLDHLASYSNLQILEKAHQLSVIFKGTGQGTFQLALIISTEISTLYFLMNISRTTTDWSVLFDWNRKLNVQNVCPKICECYSPLLLELLCVTKDTDLNLAVCKGPWLRYTEGVQFTVTSYDMQKCQEIRCAFIHLVKACQYCSQHSDKTCVHCNYYFIKHGYDNNYSTISYSILVQFVMLSTHLQNCHPNIDVQEQKCT